MRRRPTVAVQLESLCAGTRAGTVTGCTRWGQRLRPQGPLLTSSGNPSVERWPHVHCISRRCSARRRWLRARRMNAGTSTTTTGGSGSRRTGRLSARVRQATAAGQGTSNIRTRASRARSGSRGPSTTLMLRTSVARRGMCVTRHATSGMRRRDTLLASEMAGRVRGRELRVRMRRDCPVPGCQGTPSEVHAWAQPAGRQFSGC